MMVMMKMQQEHVQSRTKMMLSLPEGLLQGFLNISRFNNLNYEVP